MGRAVSAGSSRFKPGDRVRVRAEDRPGHIRTPWYIRGKAGWIERIHGEFRNPESLAFGGDGLPRRPLYLVGFRQEEVWEKYAAPKDTLFIDIYEHWLDPA
ncbi:MAG: SH3-like domain-containing protein [Candidatus Binatia bacterium]